MLKFEALQIIISKKFFFDVVEIKVWNRKNVLKQIFIEKKISLTNIPRLFKVNLETPKYAWPGITL